MPASARLCGGVALAALMLVPAAAEAQEDIGWFLAGGAIGLGLHEAGHVVAGLAAGEVPGIGKVSFGPIPFFAITHDPVTPGQEFVISSAGFWSQHLTSDLILTRHPHLRRERAPVLKGVLAFNVLASVAYSVAAFARAGPVERDTRGMAMSSRLDEPVIGAIVLAPAVLDGLRYYFPDRPWLDWTSRAVKAGGVLLVIRAAR